MCSAPFRLKVSTFTSVQEVVRLVAAREDAKERVEQLVEALEQGRDFDPNELEELIMLVEETENAMIDSILYMSFWICIERYIL